MEGVVEENEREIRYDDDDDDDEEEEKEDGERNVSNPLPVMRHHIPEEWRPQDEKQGVDKGGESCRGE